MNKKVKVKLKRQNNDNDCGVACISMVLEGMNINASAQEIRLKSKTSSKGTTIYGMLRACTCFGVQAEAMQGSMEELISSITTGEIRLPLIALMNKKDGRNHYVVVDKMNEGIHILDPEGKKYSCDYTEFSEEWSGCVVAFNRYYVSKDKAQKKKNCTHVILFNCLNGEMIHIVSITLLSFALAVTGIINGFSLQLISESATNGGTVKQIENSDLVSENADDTAEGIEKDFSQKKWAKFLHMKELLHICIVLLALSIIQTVMNWARGLLILRVKRRISENLITEYLENLVNLDYEYYNTFSKGDYYQRYENILEISEVIAQLTSCVLLDLITFVACILALAYISKFLTVLAMTILIISILVIWIFDSKLYKTNKGIADANADMEGLIVELINGFESARDNRTKLWLIECCERRFSKVIESENESGRLTISETSIVGGIISMGIVLILAINGLLIIQGVLSVGKMLSFYSIMALLLEPISKLMNMHSIIERTMVSLKRMEDIVFGVKTVETVSGTKCYSNNNDDTQMGVSIQEAYFSYDYCKDVISDYSIIISPGECIAILGRSGGGKSTLGKIMAGLLRPEKGTVTYFDQKGMELDEIYAKQNICYVSQTPYFFEGTIVDNLGVGDTTITFEEIKNACMLVGIHEDIEMMPLGYGTFLLSNGCNISVGQKQRLSLARAILRKPKLLILDEITSNLDEQSKENIYKTINNIKDMTTCIIITHDKELCNYCGRSVILDNNCK